MTTSTGNPARPLSERTRAVAEEDKAVRRQSILQAARSLFLEHPPLLPSVQSIASRAGLAKGTVYLYYRSKEEIFLSLLSDLYGAILDDIHEAVDSDHPLAQSVSQVIVDFAERHPEFMPLASMNSAVLEHHASVDSVMEFKAMLYQRIVRLSERLSQRPIGLSSAELARLLVNTQALMLGLWQMHQMPHCVRVSMAASELAILTPDFAETLTHGIQTLWAGMEAGPRPAAPQ